MLAHVLMVHGRSQQRNDPGRLEIEWEASLAAGFKAAGAEPLPAESTVFCYYGDLYVDYALRVGSRAAVRDAGERAKFELAFARAVQKKVAARGIALTPPPDIGVGEAGLSWYDPILDVLDRVPGFGPGIVRQWTRDVSDYLADFNSLRRRTMERLEISLALMQGRRPLVMIAHSMGTIVAYDLLRSRPDLTVDLLITIGAPLGVDNGVRNRLIGFRRGADDNIPVGVARWVNFADEDDIVALDESLNDDFAPRGKKFIRDVKVDNPKGNPHSSRAYLSQPKLAREILALDGAAAGRPRRRR